MRKKLCNALMVFFLVFAMTGCVKFNASMDIKKDKSMDFKIIYAFDTTYFGDQELLDSSEKAEIEQKGFTVTDYVDGTMKGFTMSRNIKNIDDVSSTEDTEYSLSGVVDSEENSKYLFKVKKGLFKNTYSAKLNFNSADSSLSDSSSIEDESDYDYDYDYDYDTDYDMEDDYTWDDESDLNTEEDELDSDADYDLSGMMDSMDLSFSVSLPYAAISNNATTVSEDGKKLTWALTTDDVSSMDFEFELYNMTAIYIGVGVLAIVIIVLIGFIAKKNGKKSVNSGSVVSMQPSESDMAQNIGRDVYQSSLQSVQTNVASQPITVENVNPQVNSVVQPQVTLNQVQMSEPVLNESVPPVAVTENLMQEQPTVSNDEVGQIQKHPIPVSDPVVPVNFTAIETPVQEQTVVSNENSMNETVQMNEQTIQNSVNQVTEDTPVETVIPTIQESSDIVLNSNDQSEVLNVDSNNQNLN